MYRLKKIPNGLLQIHSRTPAEAYEGPANKIIERAVNLGVWEPDIEVALEEMHKHNHDYAEFGAEGGFLFTGVSRVS